MIELEEIRERYGLAKQRVHELAPDREVKIVAVTKKFPPALIERAIEAGVTDIGENYAQEAVAKNDEISRELTWHFIGQLQRNKVKSLAPFVDVWHTVDSLQLIDEISKRAPRARVLIQVNFSDDENRGGCKLANAGSLVEYAAGKGLDAAGLMGVATQEAEIEVGRQFASLRKAANELGLRELSMGMSNDFEIAVKEGATIVRLGSSLFGPRM